MEKKTLTTTEFSAKFRSKQEVYRFLAYEAEVYLPPYHSVTVWHLRDLCSGKRKPIKANKVKTITIPIIPVTPLPAPLAVPAVTLEKTLKPIS